LEIFGKRIMEVIFKGEWSFPIMMGAGSHLLGCREKHYINQM